MKKGSAETIALTLFSIVFLTLAFSALKTPSITGLAVSENESEFSTQSFCGGAVPCGCGDRITDSWIMNSDLICSGNGLVVEDDDLEINCNGHELKGDKSGYGFDIKDFENITIKNCTIKNFTRGINIENSQDNNLINNSILNNTRCINIEYSKDILIADNTIDDGEYGILLSYSNSTTIETNSFDNNGASTYGGGIDITNSKYNLVSGNKISNSAYNGVYIFRNSTGNDIIDNEIQNSSNHGIYSRGVSGYSPRENSIEGNFIFNSTAHGIQFEKTNSSNVKRNTIEDCNIGINLISSSRHNLIELNNASKNSDGVKLSQSCNYVNITYNRFLNNTGNGIDIGDSDSIIVTENIVKENDDEGIYVSNSENNTISYNDIFNNSLGISIYRSHENTIIGNVVVNSTSKGIYLNESDNNTISRNNASENYPDGIELMHSDNNTAKNNTVFDNDNGITITLSELNKIQNNNAYSNGQRGIYVSYSNNNAIEKNNVTANPDGISINQGDNNTVALNTIKDSTKGIEIYNFAFNNTAEDNILKNNSRGIELYESGNNSIINNTVKNSTQYCIYLGLSYYNNFVDNTIYNCTESGIEIDRSNNTLVQENSITLTDEYGIFLDNSSNNQIIFNNISDTTDHGILIWISSLKNNIENNRITNSSKSGLFSFSITGHNNISNNTITNSINGISFSSSDNCDITRNNITNNQEAGIKFVNSDNNNITKNYITKNELGLKIYQSAQNNQIYNNYFDNDVNFVDNGTGNSFNITKTNGENILGKDYLGGNYWEDYRGQDLTGDWLGDTRLPYEERDYLPLTYNSMATLDVFELNSTYGSNTTDQDLNCWVNSTDADEDNVTYHVFWHKNGIEQVEHKWTETKTNSYDYETFDVASDSKNNLFVAGLLASPDKQSLIIKYNSSGSEKDSLAESSSGEDREWFGITTDFQDNVIAVGYESYSGNPYMKISKYNNSLSLIDEIKLNLSDSVSIAQSAAIDYKDNIIVAGYSNESGNYDFKIFKFDEDLDEIWNVTFDSAGNDDYAMDVAVDSDNNIYVTGRSRNSSNDWDFLTVKYYENKTYAWNKTYDTSTSDRAYGIGIDSNDMIYTAGRTSATNPDILLVVYNSTGNEEWTKTMNYGLLSEESAESVVVDSRDYIILGGWTDLTGAGKKDCWIIKLNSSGDGVWNYTYGTSEHEYCYGVTADNYDDIILAGKSQTASWESLIVKYGGFTSEEHEPETLVSASSLDSSKTAIGDNWTCEVRIYDGNSYGVYNMSGNLEIVPDTAAIWSQNKTSPDSPAVYAPGKAYQFNVSWENNIYVDTVYIQHNFTGTLANYSPTGVNGIEYYYNYSDLAVGTYEWSMWANDTAGLWNHTDIWTYAVTKSDSEANLKLNNVDGNITVQIGDTVEINGTLIRGEGNLTLYYDGSHLANGTSPVETALAIGSSEQEINITVEHPETQNYTASSETHFIIVRENPVIEDVFINSTSIYTNADDNLTCWVNATESNGGNLSYSGEWYRNGSVFVDKYWNITEGGTESDYAHDIAVDSNEDMIVTGYKTISGISDIWTIKYDSAGNELWNKTSGGTSADRGKAIAIDSNDNIIVAGSTVSLGAGAEDFWIIKYDLSGNELWNKTAGGVNADSALSVAVDSNDNIIVTGSTWSHSAGRSDIWTIKYDSAGNELWNKTTGGTENDYGYGIAVDSNDNILITGHKSISLANTDLWTIKYDSAGNELWNKTSGGTGIDGAYGIGIDSNNNIIVAGYSSSFGYSQAWTIKYDSAGNELWNKTTGTKVDKWSAVAIDRNDNIILTGYTDTLGAGDWDFLTMKYDSSGNHIWNKTEGGTARDNGNGIAIDSDDNIFVTGVTKSFGAGDWDFHTIKYRNGFNAVNQENGKLVSLDTLESQFTTAGENWSCKVRAFDGNDFSDYLMSSNVTITAVKTPANCSLNFTPVSSPQIYGTLVNASCSCNNPETSPVLYRNNIDVSSENNVFTLLGAGNYTYNCTSAETSNYYDDYNSSTYNITRNYTIVDITASPSWNETEGTQTTVTCTASNTQVNLTLYRNGTNVTNPEISKLSQGTYNYTCLADGNDNYTSNISEKNLTIREKPASSGRSSGGGSSSRCYNECELGTTACGAGNVLFICLDPDNDGCTEWTEQPCSADEKCEEGMCVPIKCIEDWICEEWGRCEQGYQTRECFDFNSCGTYEMIPKTSQQCQTVSGVDEDEQVLPEDLEQYIDVETEADREDILVQKEKPSRISQSVKRAAGYGAAGLAGLIILIAGIVAISRHIGVESFIDKEIKQRIPEEKIKIDIMKKGYNEDKAEKMLYNEEIKTVKNIIKDHKKKGFKIDEIKKELLAKGWDRKYVEHAAVELEKVPERKRF